MYPGKGTVVLIRPAQTFYERIKVVIALSSSDTSEGTVSPASLTFTSADGTTPQTVTVTGVDDPDVDGDIAYTIVTDAAVSTDGDYNSVNPADVEVTNTDDDGVGGGNNCFETDDTTARCDRPVPIGVSSGHPSITVGTIGMRVTDGTDVYALSNNHVYAATNSATIGDKVLQPSTIDGGTDPADAIGTLDDFEPILFDGSDNIMDAAIALSSTANLGNSTPNNGYGVPSSATQVATVGLRVIKYGRTTEETKGKVYAIDATVNVCYEVTDGACTKQARFVDQDVVLGGNFSAPGDSGSFVVTPKGGYKGVGLLFAGSVNATILSPIDPILARFGVTIDGN